MNKTITTLLVTCTLALAACGGVDRAGTRDQFIEDAERDGITVDGDCVDNVLDQYSDDEIELFASGDSASSPEMIELGTALVGCTDLVDG